MGESTGKPFWSSVPGILTGLAAVITAVAAVITAFSRDSAPRESKSPDAQTKGAISQSADSITWQRNWLTVSQPRGSLGSGGRTWTNRDAFLGMIRALEINEGDPLASTRDQLLTLALSTPEDLTNGPQWSLPYSADMQHLEAELKRGIRDRAIKYGVNVTTELR